MKRLIFLLMLADLAFAGTARHVVPSGGLTSGAALTEGTGWTLVWSGSASNTTIQPGDTVYIHAGTYDVPSGGWQVRPDGTALNPIIYRNWNNGRVLIRAIRDDAEWTVPVYGDYLWFWGLEIDRTVEDNNNTSHIPIGLGNKLINCVIKNSGGNATTMFREAVGAEVYGCIFIYDGHWDGGNGQHAYPVYFQNKTADGWKWITDNIMFFPFSFGVHGYSGDDESSYSIQRTAVRGNTVVSSGVLWDGIRHHAMIFGVENGNPYGNVDSLDICNNYIYWPPGLSGSGAGIDVNYGSRPANNLKIDSNIVVNNDYALLGYATNTYRSITKNILSTGWSPSGLSTSYTNNSWLTSTPSTGDTAIVRPNVYETKRAHLIVYNWDQGDSVSVSLASTGFAGGDTLRIYHIGNLQGDTPFQKVYAGSSFNVPMMATRWTNETPTTVAAPSKTFPRFGVFLITASAGAGAAIPTQLTFSQNPTGTVWGSTISPAVTVRIEESNGTLVSTDTRNVTIAVLNNPSGATLSGTTTVAASGGIATFSNLSLNKPGVGYTLRATATALTSDTSSAFTLTQQPLKRRVPWKK